MAIGVFSIKEYLERDEGFSDWFPDDNLKSPVKRNNTFHMLGHVMRVTTVKDIGINDDKRVFLTCDCCSKPFHVKLEILERDLNKVTLDKL
jgi:hypothetical protein